MSRATSGAMGGTLSAVTSPAKLCVLNATAIDAKYTSLAAQLPSRGFDAAALQASSRLFDDAEPPVPRRYSEPPWSLPSNAIRVLALPLSDDQLSDAPTRRLAQLAMHAARDVASALPERSRLWLPPRASGLHATLFHPGLSPQFDTLGKLCNLPLPVPPAGCWQRAGLGAGSPSDGELGHEFRAARRLAASMPSSLSFDVDRLVVTSSGVMLLLLRPRLQGRAHASSSGGGSGGSSRSGEGAKAACVESLRAAAAAAFPRAARRQTSGLVHVSLLRVLSLPSPEAFGANSSAALAVLAVLERWNAKLRGLRLHVTARGMLYVRETQIMTLEGERFRMHFGAKSSSLGDVLAQGGTRTGYDLDRHDSQKA